MLYEVVERGRTAWCTGTGDGPGEDICSGHFVGECLKAKSSHIKKVSGMR